MRMAREVFGKVSRSSDGPWFAPRPIELFSSAKRRASLSFPRFFV